MTFHERLGTQADRVERVTQLATALAPVVGADREETALAAHLSKADLVTQMVGEFPELQGYVGRRYAEAEGLPPAVCAAMEEHYRPLGPGDPVPVEPVAVTLALADKAVMLTGLWLAGEKPSGSGDPYSLRRAALGIIRIVLENGVRYPIADRDVGLVPEAARTWHFSAVEVREEEIDAIVDFILERFIVQQREAGVPAEIVRAVIPVLPAVDLVDVTHRIAALRDFLATDDGANLMTGYRRAANILRAEEKDGETFAFNPDPAHLSTGPDQRLLAALAAARSAVAAAVKAEDYRGAMAAIAALRAPVDDFFDTVRVNDENPDVRTNRLRLLAALREVTRQVADFSEIPG